MSSSKPNCSSACDSHLFAVQAKYLARHRRISAISFLSNISLDGTHRDTNLYFQSKQVQKPASTNHLKPTDVPAVNGESKNEVEKKDGEPVVPVIANLDSPGRAWSDESVLSRESASLRLKKVEDREPLRQRTRTEGQSYFADHRPLKERLKLGRKFNSSSSSILCKPNQGQKFTSIETVDSQSESEHSGRKRQRSGSHSDSASTSQKGERRLVRFLSPLSKVFDSDDHVSGLSGLQNAINLGDNRFIMVSSSCRAPVLISSVLPYIKGNKISSALDYSSSAKEKKRAPSNLKPISDIPEVPVLTKPHKQSWVNEELGEVSYKRYLEPSSKKIIENPKSLEEDYVVAELDDPEMVAGRHRTLLNFPSYRTSVIEYVQPRNLKRELNDKFRERYPRLDLSLSKLRSLKREMRRIAVVHCSLDLGTLAQAYVYFEKAVFKGFVNKENRKLVAGAALLLAGKLNDVRGADLHHLIERIGLTFRVQRKDLLGTEFTLFVSLEFALLSSVNDVLPHYHRLIYGTC